MFFELCQRGKEKEERNVFPFVAKNRRPAASIVWIAYDMNFTEMLHYAEELLDLFSAFSSIQINTFCRQKYLNFKALNWVSTGLAHREKISNEQPRASSLLVAKDKRTARRSEKLFEHELKKFRITDQDSDRLSLAKIRCVKAPNEKQTTSPTPMVNQKLSFFA